MAIKREIFLRKIQCVLANDALMVPDVIFFVGQILYIIRSQVNPEN